MPLLPHSSLLAALLLALGATASTFADEPASLVKNGDFETKAAKMDWPEGWPGSKDGQYLVEEGNHFIRLTSPTPGATVMMYDLVPIPDGVKALEVSWRQRITNLKVGANSWFDARIMMDFRNGNEVEVKPAPPAPYTRKDTESWVERTTQFLVPDGATVMRFMPSLLQVESGTFDLDDIRIKSIDPGALLEAATAAKAKKESSVKEEQDKAADALKVSGSLIPNGNFEQHDKSETWPDGWGKGGNFAWGEESGNHFLRLTSPAPGAMVMQRQELMLPPEAKALELTFRQRATGLKPGKEAWFDARILMEFRDAAGKEVKPGAPAPNVRGDTKGWVDKKISFLVPEGAVKLVFSPTLLQVNAGTWDLDDIVLKPTDPAPVLAAAAAAAEDKKKSMVPPEAPLPAKWAPELHVQGNQLVTKEGKPVWLQGVNVITLEFLANGDHVEKSAIVAVDEWKANVIRLPIKGKFWMEPGAKGQAYQKLVDNVVNLITNRGAYVVIDHHSFGAVREADLPFWTEVATKYKNHPAVLFDIINEPHGITWEVWRNGGFVEERKSKADEDAFLTEEERKKLVQGYQSPGMQKLVETVRATGAKNIIAAGGLDWAYDLSGVVNGFALEDKTGNGIMYSTHIYNWKSDWKNKVLATAAKYPILVGEVGADIHKMNFMDLKRQEDPSTWVPDMLGLIQKYKLNWTGWSFHPGATPVMISDWNYTPTPYWGQPAKEALSGKQYQMDKMR